MVVVVVEVVVAVVVVIIDRNCKKACNTFLMKAKLSKLGSLRCLQFPKEPEELM